MHAGQDGSVNNIFGHRTGVTASMARRDSNKSMRSHASKLSHLQRRLLELHEHEEVGRSKSHHHHDRKDGQERQYSLNYNKNRSANVEGAPSPNLASRYNNGGHEIEEDDISHKIHEIKKHIDIQEKQELEEFEKNLTPEEKSERRRILAASMCALFSINTLLLCAEAVLPIYIEKRHKEFIDETKTAIIIAYDFLLDYVYLDLLRLVALCYPHSSVYF